MHLTREHTCLPNFDFWKVRKLRESILSRCSTRDVTRRRDIISQESSSYARSVRMLCSVKILRSAMRRARMKVLPCIPKDLSQLDSILRSTRYKHLTMTKGGDSYLYAGRCGSSKFRTRCLIFQSKTMQKIMATCDEVFADCTWDDRPACPNSSQVFSITVSINKQILPVCVCIMESKTMRSYRCLLRAIKKLNPQFDPKKIHTDFETAEYDSFKEEFPAAIVEGCLYHYSNNVSSQARKLGYACLVAQNPVADSLVRSCLAIPLVPQNRLQEALGAVIIRSRDEGFGDFFDPFFKYIWDEYISKRGHVLSVHGSENRTNNIAESWNNMLQEAVIVRRPNVFNFLNGLLKLEDQAAQNYYEIVHGMDTSRGRRISALINDKVIKNLSRLLHERKVSMADFLRRSSRCLENPYRRYCPHPPPM